MLETLRDVIAPLVEADGGAVYVVARAESLRIHLAGACAGCPGQKTTSREIIEPALRAAGHRGDLEISAGWTIPEGAQRIGGPIISIIDEEEIEPLSEELFSPQSSQKLGG